MALQIPLFFPPTDSPAKISATTNNDLLDLLELTAPVASAPSKNVDTASLLKSLPETDGEFAALGSQSFSVTNYVKMTTY